MKTFRIFVCLLLMIAFAIPSGFADTEITFSGQLRARSELDKRSFIEDAHWQQYYLFRTRFNVEATVDENTHAFIQFQDSREAGDLNQFGERQSGLTNDSKNVDVHQAYVKVDRIFFDGFGMKAGRFEVNLGNQRVFGAVGWDNVGRAWEGVKAFYKGNNFKITGMQLKAYEANNFIANQDFDIYGGKVSLTEQNWDFFIFYERNQDTSGTDDSGINSLDRYDIGTYYSGTHEDFDYNFNFVYQFGNYASFNGAWDEADIGAFLITAGFNYNFDSEYETSFGLGIDYASGDDDFTDNKNSAYNNLYFTGHKFNGYMDYWVNKSGTAYEFAGLMDLIGRFAITPAPDWRLKADVHLFKTAKDYPYGGEEVNDGGFEVDLTATTTRFQGLTLDIGASYFAPQDGFAGTDKNADGIWGYIQGTVDF